MSKPECDTKLPWMSDDYFSSILSKIEGHSEFELIEFIVNSGSNKGENFASAIYRVDLIYKSAGESKQTVVILKACSATSVISEMLESAGTFDGETFVYDSILRECAKLFPKQIIAPR